MNPSVQPNFVYRLFSEPDEKPSFARVFAAMIIFVALAMILFVTFKDGKIPDLAGPTLLIGGAVGLYGSNKVASAIADKK